MIWVLVGEMLLIALVLGLRLRQATAQWTASAPRPSATRTAGVGWIFDWFSSIPLARLNTLLELIAAVGIFALVRHWSITDDLAPPRDSTWRAWMSQLAAWITSVQPAKAQSFRKPEPAAKPRAYQGWGRAIAAALLFWLNPALLLSGHGWGGAEVWPLPFVIFAILACSTERWLAGGILVGLAAVLNGHVMLAAPVFLLWPLCMNAPRATLRACVGFAAAVAASAAPALVGSGPIWVAGVMLAPAIVRRKWFNRGPLASIAVMAPIAFALIVWPAILSPNRTLASIIVLGLFALGLIYIGRKLNIAWLGTLIALAGTIGLSLCPMLFGGSFEPLAKLAAQLGVDSPHMTTGAHNLPSILHHSFGVRTTDPLYTIDLPALSIYHIVTLKQALAGMYFVTLLVAGAAAAAHANRNDPRTLVALLLPCVLCFSLLTGMDERGLVCAAAISACWVAAGSGMALVHLFISALAFLMVGSAMNHDGDFDLSGLLGATEGALPCLTLLAAAMTTWGALGRTRAA